jgi:AcrR family transcriptional regulator
MGVSGSTESIALPSDRSRLIEAMAKSCAKRGYAETTIEDVVDDARLTREDFDRHFASKEACAVEAVETILGKTMVEISAAYSADMSEAESTLGGLRAILELFAAHPALASMAMIHSRQMMPERGLAVYESGFTVLTSMLDRLRDNLVGDSDMPNVATRAAIGGAEALVRRELAAGRAERLPQLLPDLVYSAAVALLGREDALALARRARALQR